MRLACGCSPERSIQATSKLCGITHESDFAHQTSINEPLLDPFCPPIHHITRRNAMSTCFSVIDCYFT